MSKLQKCLIGCLFNVIDQQSVMVTRMAESKEIEKEVIKACMDIALENVEHGCLFVIDLNEKPKHSYYTKVFKSLKGNDGKPLSVLREEDKYIIRHFAALDGAVVIDKAGEMLEFGVTLKNHLTFLGHGKRHAFALGTSKLPNVVCILTSEEDKHVRLLREGVCVADVDSRSYVPANLRHKVVEVLDTPLSKVLIGAGIATSILTLNPIPAIVTITGSTVIVSFGFDKLKNIFQKQESVQPKKPS